MHMSINVARSDAEDNDEAVKAARSDFADEAKRRGYKVSEDTEPEVTFNGGIVRVEGQVEPDDADEDADEE